MSDREEKLSELRSELREKRDRLHKRVRDIWRDMQRESVELERDFEDQATQLENEEVLDALEPATRRELQDVLAALERFDEGAYGICVDCDDPIDVRRLEALPYALRCIDCAEDAETKPPAAKGGSREEMSAQSFDDFPDSEK